MHIFKPIIRCILVMTAFFVAVLAIYLLYICYNHSTIVCKDLSKLEELIKMDLSNIQIIDIYSHISKSSEYTEIIICAKAEEGYTEKEFYVSTNRSGIYDIPQFEVERLGRYSLEPNDIHNHGCCFGDIKSGISDVGYQIRWYEICTNQATNINLIISTDIPRRIYIDIPLSKKFAC